MFIKGFLILGLLGAQTAMAASAQLRYVDLERILLSKNKDIQIARLNKEQSEHGVSSSYSGFLPSVTLYDDTSKTFDTAETSAKKIYSTSIGIKQNLFSGFQDYFKVQDAKLELDQVKNTLSIEELNQVAELKVAFASVFKAQRMVQFSGRIIETRKNIKELVFLRLSSGNETKDSMLFAEAQLEESELDLATSLTSLEAAKRKLGNVLGEELPLQYEVVGNVNLAAMPTNPDFKKLSIDSLEFKNAAISERRSLEDIKNNQAKFLPTVDFSILRERENKRSFSEQDYNKNYYTKYMLSVTLPLFEGFTTYHELKVAELEGEKTKLNLTKVSEDYYTQLRDTYDKLTELKKRKEINLKLLEAAKMRDLIYTSKYRLGIISFEVWIDSQNDLIDYEKNVIEVDLDIETNLSKWETLANIKG